MINRLVIILRDNQTLRPVSQSYSEKLNIQMEERSKKECKTSNGDWEVVDNVDCGWREACSRRYKRDRGSCGDGGHDKDWRVLEQ